ncbi:hypothetical protein GGX14DRAFT_678190 [Mycena pura]|uniref:non-specific serine/threonine protein kinase n=1 Tax=Mycena pura TaxID=153505 RepID=A0AAD6Y7D7_9AGAR|nr:hypothetical protein GGX14DRAFT_678190 [Mycena pura]
MAQHPGTLVPGQSISVNKFTVQVERYLSQGGFAHVYLVRTATPVYNTTHHVLKRIAVANDTMLTEVKKEVDIMRLLKGHPNIVHLIDAAWHRMQNGLYEVFILMEFCPGGGIIDMMNRRLRERLSEAEILQIFVDVCEGVAYMHNSRPPLLHRDLKVENILQASATSFKLCDFGSATTVTPRPTTTQEIRALEADLNRHTTLQYRAPEMVDPYLRRPVDEKSDVWALGVLLYKLCYYTTPFEEHGPLAILNVQYRIPPYPVYSTQMNTLIGSMLREHGHQRPSVFELLSGVHRLRGTKSQFSYNIPPPQPLSPRAQQTQFSPPANPLESTISYRSQQQLPPPTNPGIQARDKVLEAIAPMRRGRPTTESYSSASPSKSRNASPPKAREPTQSASLVPEKTKNWLEEEDKAWQAATRPSNTNAPSRSSPLDEAWVTRGGTNSTAMPSKGFGDDFAEKLWDEFDPQGTTVKSAVPIVPPAGSGRAPAISPTSLHQRAFTGSLAVNNARGGYEKDKDAFEGLGLSSSGGKPAPTLGEARLLRTGLAGTSSSSHKYSGSSGDYKDYKPSRPLPSPRPTYLSQSLSTPGMSPAQTLSPNPPALKPSSSGSSWQSQPPTSMSRPGSGFENGNDLAENRFPSLEELDKTFNGTAGPSSVPPLPPRKNLSPEMLRSEKPSSYGSDGVRSQQITSITRRDAGSSHVAQAIPTSSDVSSLSRIEGSRPSLTRKHRSSTSMKHNYASGNDDGALPSRTNLSSTSSSGVPSSSSRNQDWLTGDDEVAAHLPSSTATMPANPNRSSGPTSRTDYKSAPVMRESPSKRASFIEKAPLHIQEGVVLQREYTRDHIPPSPSSPSTRAQRVFPVIDLSAEPAEQGWHPTRAARQQEVDSSSSADEGPEDVNGFRSTPVNKLKSTQEVGRAKRKGRQSSVHDLVDLYGGPGSLPLPSKPKENERVSQTPVDDLTPRKSAFGSAQMPWPETKAKRPAALASVSTADPRSSDSVSSTLSPPNSEKQLSSGPRKSPATTAPPSPRSRPQSMFIFPSGRAETVPSSTLSPPEDPKPRVHRRRTSISDMVLRYEAIGGSKSPASPNPPNAPPLTVASKSLTSAAPRVENEWFSSVSSQGTTHSSSSGINGRQSGATPLPVGDPSKGVSLPPRVSPTDLPRTSKPQESATASPAPVLARVRLKSIDLGGTTSQPPSRKPTADERSPSPERPYQGVGKLIDQWQRKTAESDATHAPVGGKRGGAGSGFVAKRAGVVGKGS